MPAGYGWRRKCFHCGAKLKPPGATACQVCGKEQPKPEAMEPVDPRKLHRQNDPQTSKKAAMAHPRARLNQSQIMLKAHGDAYWNDEDNYLLKGMICDEAWLAAGRTLPSISCHHHRHSSLADDYDPPLLERVEGMTRIGNAGLPRQVYILTVAGFEYWQEYLT